MLSIKDVILGSDYDFLRTDEFLVRNIIFLCYGGSYAYGTNRASSDIDIRGCVFNTPNDLLGFGKFEQFTHSTTDTVLYGFNKFIHLLCNCNPNVIESLGCRSDHYIFCNSVGERLVSERKMFLSRRAIKSFGGYAYQQLTRLQNAVARDALSLSEKENHLLCTMRNMLDSFGERYTSFDDGAITLYIGDSAKTDLDTEIFMNVDLKNYPLRDFKSIWSEMNELIKVYGKLNHRNHKKDVAHLNKHACHLIRLYLMVFDILEKEDVITYREGDLPLLMDILNGTYMNSDGTYRSEFFELVDFYAKRLEYAKANSSLPVEPAYDRIEDFVMSVNKQIVTAN